MPDQHFAMERSKKICEIAIDKTAVSRWSLNMCGYTITVRILWMEGHLSLERETASMSRGHQTAQTCIATTVEPDDLQRVARQEFNRARSNRRLYTSRIYIAHSCQSVNEITYQNRISWICYYRLIHKDFVEIM